MRHSLLHIFSIFLLSIPLAATAKTPINIGVSSSLTDQQPVVLVQNNGQVQTTFNAAPENVLFYAYQNKMSIFLQPNCISYQFFDGSFQTEKNSTTFRTDMRLVGASHPSKVEALDKDDYFETHYSAEEKRVIVSPSYHRILFHDVYPKIDWVVYVSDFGIKYDFIVHPGGNPDLIQLEYAHADNVTIESDGALKVETKLGNITEAKPYSYTNTGTPIQTSFKMENKVVSFSLEAYNKTKTLTIDPDVVWTSYLGGTGYDEVRGICADENGNIYLTGFTSATAGIATGGYQTTYGGGNYDAFVSKFNMSGQRLWTTYFGGTGSDFGNAIDIDGQGNIYIAGATSTESNLAFGLGLLDYAGGQYDGFAAKFSPNGTLLWSTYIGGIDEDGANSIAVDAEGNAAVLAYTYSYDTYVTNNYQSEFGGGATDMLLTMFNALGEMQWNTFIGKTGEEMAGKVALMNNQYVIVTGATSSTSGIAVGGPQTTHGGGFFDGYLGFFNYDGTLFWSSYIGGEGDDEALDVDISLDNNVYVSGSTSSLSNIATLGAIQTNYGGGEYDAFLGQFTPDGVKNWVTYFGGEGLDRGHGVAVDELGNVYLGGISSSLTNVNEGGFQTEIGGGTDLFFAFYNNLGEKQWSSYFGGIDDESMYTLAADENSRALFAGSSQSSNMGFNGWDTSYGGGTDALFGKVQDCNNPYVTVDPLGPTQFCQGEEVGFTVGGADSFDWSTGDSTTVISVDTTMTVFVIGQLAGTNCRAMSNVIHVEMLQIPEVFALPGGDVSWCGIGGVWIYASAEEGFEPDFYTWSTSAIGDSIYVTESGSYSSSVIVENGCEATSLPVVVEVIEAPDVIAAINTDVTCISTPSVNIIALPFGGTFYGEGVIGNSFIPELAGGGTHEIYYEYVDQDGCISQSSPMFIEVLFEETILFVDANELCLSDEPIGMYGFPEGGYFSGPGVSGDLFYPSIAGVGSHEVFYNYTDGNGCNNRGAQTIAVDGCNSVSESAGEEIQISIYPNPVNDMLYFNANGAELESAVVFNSIGQIVFQQTLTSTIQNIDFNFLASGLYTIQFKSKEKRYTLQFIKS